MRYGEPYYMIELSDSFITKLETMVLGFDTTDAVVLSKDGVNPELSQLRSSKVSWLNDEELSKSLLGVALKVNSLSNWNLNLYDVEQPQYTVYNSGDYYSWHIDQDPEVPNLEKRIRKLSMSLFLNEPKEYSGGELDLELYSPDSDERSESFKLSKGSAIFFPSDIWHRVRPVISGVRKTLVVWFGGPPYT